MRWHGRVVGSPPSPVLQIRWQSSSRLHCRVVLTIHPEKSSLDIPGLESSSRQSIWAKMQLLFVWLPSWLLLCLCSRQLLILHGWSSQPTLHFLPWLLACLPCIFSWIWALFQIFPPATSFHPPQYVSHICSEPQSRGLNRKTCSGKTWAGFPSHYSPTQISAVNRLLFKALHQEASRLTAGSV